MEGEPGRELARAEARGLVEELAAHFTTLVGVYEKHLNETRSEAIEDALAPLPDDYLFDPLDSPYSRFGWAELLRMVANEPDLGAESWLQVREAAADELASGHRAARAIEFIGDLDDRARFLELRESFIRDWQPRPGIETALIDAMTQAFSLYERWLARSAGRMEVMNVREDRQGRVRGWSPPMQMEADALHQAAEMADRFNRIFLRNLRALRDLRRYAGSVVVQNAGQVNVGGQQVNLSGG